MKKKLIALLLALAMTLSLLTVGASARTVDAYGVCGSYLGADDDYIYIDDNVSWTLYSDGTLVLSGEGDTFNNPTALDAPSGCFFAAIDFGDDEYLYDIRENITSVVVESGVTSIGQNLFMGCTNLTSVSFPSTLTSIGSYAFSGTGLTSVTLPGTLTNIGFYVFDNCSSLKTAVLENGIQNLNGDIFTNCSLDSITIPGSVKTLRNLGGTAKQVIVQEGVTELRPNAFSGWNTLQSISLPSTLTTIGDMAFSGCTSLTSFSIPDSVTSIGSDVFNNCSSLRSVSLGSGITDFGTAFRNCTGLQSFVMPDTVKSLSKYAFQGCTSLKEITLSKNLKTIPGCAFEECHSLTSIEIPEGVTSIAGSAFDACWNLQQVYLPSSLTLIDYQAFMNCGKLSDLEFKGDAPTFRDNCFVNCTVTAYYPADNDTWTEDVMQNYQGTVTWKSYKVVDNDVTRTFTDVSRANWFAPYVQSAVDMGIMNGTGETTFEPYGKTSRAMVVQILYAMENKPSVEGMENPFSDVGKAWYHDAVVWAYNTSVTSGTSETTFSPTQDITRQEIAVMLYAYVGRPPVEGDLSAFADESNVSSWARNALIWANQNGIINGSQDGDALNLNPKNTAARAETATMMVAFSKYYAENGKYVPGTVPEDPNGSR